MLARLNSFFINVLQPFSELSGLVFVTTLYYLFLVCCSSFGMFHLGFCLLIIHGYLRRVMPSWNFLFIKDFRCLCDPFSAPKVGPGAGLIAVATMCIFVQAVLKWIKNIDIVLGGICVREFCYKS